SISINRERKEGRHAPSSNQCSTPQEEMKVHYKFTYFYIRGRGEPIRMLFNLAGVQFEDKRIQLEEWPKLKSHTPFGSLPVLEFDNQKLGQSQAIMRYLATRFGLSGRTPVEEAQVDAFADCIVDFTNAINEFHLVACGLLPGVKGELYEREFCPAKEKLFAIMEKQLKKNGTGWLVGNSITSVDIQLACCLQSMIDESGKEKEEILKGFEEIGAHQRKVYSHPRIAPYIESRPYSPF
ncbi:hypothetical protein PRIPAC_87283, partial [Pristionchus pacificus]